MRYLLDTCVFAEYSKAQPSEKVIDWVDSQIQEALYISVVTVGEIEKGIVKMRPSRRRTGIEGVLESLLIRFDDRIIPIDTSVARRWGNLTGNLEIIGRPLPIIDSVIAATALEHRLTLVTRNVADFVPTKAVVLNIWE
jgi:predicted nucleic acid-binding protein